MTLLGAGLLATLVLHSEPDAVLGHLQRAGPGLLLLLLAIYLVYFAGDALNWLAALADLAPLARWFPRVYVVRLIGDAWNNITPTATLGGDALKAWLMQRHYGVPLNAGAASLVVSRSTNMLALVLFALVGCGLSMFDRSGDGVPWGIALAGLGLITVGTAGFILLQFLRVPSRAMRLAGRSRWRQRVVRLALAAERFDDRIATFYRRHRARLLLAVSAAFATYVLGALELWLILRALGADLSFGTVWAVEVLTQLVRAATFFIPAGLGTQDAAIVFAIGSLGGSQVAGVAAALLRRARELVWIALSLCVGLVFTWRDPPLPATLDGTTGNVDDDAA